MRRNVFAVAVAATLGCGVAHAELVQGDGFTTDTNSGLEWLNLTATQGVSLLTVLQGYGGYTTSGWVLATGAQIQQLAIGNIGTADFIHCDDNCGQGYPHEEDYNELTSAAHTSAQINMMADLGFTYQNVTDGVLTESSRGYYSDLGAAETVPADGRALVAGNGQFNVTIDLATNTPTETNWGTFSAVTNGGIFVEQISGDSGLSNYGTFLVRAADVPEPATWALFGLGLVGIALTRRRRVAI